MILPYIEQGNLYKAIDFTYPPETPGMEGPVINFMPAWQNPGRVNADACRAVVPTFLCPSDPAGTPSDWPGRDAISKNSAIISRVTATMKFIGRHRPSEDIP